MAREPRVEVTGMPHHLIVRGNNRETIFIDANCYIRYAELLRGYKTRCGYKVYCYCLMPNHIHLVLEPSETATISKIMQRINTSYTLYFNNKFKRTGHVLEGRYRSRVIESDNYLLYLSKYIHINPVKARLCQRPQDYRYSSCKNYIGEINNEFVDTNFLLKMLDENVKPAKREYEMLLNNDYEIDADELGVDLIE